MRIPIQLIWANSWKIIIPCLGWTKYRGQGLVITLKDADSSNFVGNAAKAIVHDADLMEVVNALKEAGAEAISINGERIVNTTSIICSGNIIQIDGEKVGSPYEIKAIGLI